MRIRYIIWENTSLLSNVVIGDKELPIKTSRLALFISLERLICAFSVFDDNIHLHSSECFFLCWSIRYSICLILTIIYKGNLLGWSWWKTLAAGIWQMKSLLVHSYFECDLCDSQSLFIIDVLESEQTIVNLNMKNGFLSRSSRKIGQTANVSSK